jgi:hypothetical protein
VSVTAVSPHIGMEIGSARTNNDEPLSCVPWDNWRWIHTLSPLLLKHIPYFHEWIHELLDIVSGYCRPSSVILFGARESKSRRPINDRFMVLSPLPTTAGITLSMMNLTAPIPVGSTLPSYFQPAFPRVMPTISLSSLLMASNGRGRDGGDGGGPLSSLMKPIVKSLVDDGDDNGALASTNGDCGLTPSSWYQLNTLVPHHIYLQTAVMKHPYTTSSMRKQEKDNDDDDTLMYLLYGDEKAFLHVSPLSFNRLIPEQVSSLIRPFAQWGLLVVQDAPSMPPYQRYRVCMDPYHHQLHIIAWSAGEIRGTSHAILDMNMIDDNHSSSPKWTISDHVLPHCEGACVLYANESIWVIGMQFPFHFLRIDACICP